MYSRSYYPDEPAMRIPEGYDGTALLEQPMAEIAPKEAQREPIKREVKVSPREKEEEAVYEKPAPEDTECIAHADKWQMPPFLKNIIPSDIRFSSLISGIGSEEILIAAIALFLFFSKGGDKLCAGILLFLIFIR
jgi:hypothetical protein